MAQAPGKEEEEGTRKTTTYNKFEGMESQNERFNVKPNEMFWIENIMRTGPRKLSSVPGPAFRRFFPASLPTLCTDATERGQQHMSVVTAFQQQTFNNRTSWAFVSPAGDVTTMIGVATCGLGNMFYDTCCSLNHFIDNIPIVNDHPALIDPATVPAINTLIGISDAPAYASYDGTFGAGLGDGVRIWYPNDNTFHDYIRPLVGWTGFTAIHAYAIKGDEVWIRANEGSTKTPVGFVQYDRSTGGILANYAVLGSDFVTNMNLTASNLVCLTSGASDSTNRAIKKIARSDGSVAATIDLSDLKCSYLFAVNDSLIYVLCAANSPAIPAKMYYWNGSALVYVGIVNNMPPTPFTQASGQFSGGRYYFGSTGFGGFTTDIFSFAIGCPSGLPLVATVTAGAGSVAPGGTIPVSWADVLEPNPFFPTSSDRIVMYPKPAAGKLSFFVSTAVAEQITDGSSTGSMTFTVPGGTPAGDYVFRYQCGSRDLEVLVATSAPFTVT